MVQLFINPSKIDSTPLPYHLIREPRLEFAHAGLADDDFLGHFDIQVDGQLVAKPDGDILDGVTRDDELTVGSEKHIGVKLGHQIIQSMGQIIGFILMRH